MSEDRRVAIIGLGYVGLPLAVAFAEAGLEVEGVDSAAGRVAELSGRRSPIEDVADARCPGQLIVLQSTTYPGTTTGPFRAELERSGLRAGAEGVHGQVLRLGAGWMPGSSPR